MQRIETIYASLLQSLTNPVSHCFCRKPFPPTTSNTLIHTWTSLNYHSYVWTIIHTNSTFKKWQVIDGSAWTNSSKHQTMQRAQETTPQEKTLYACALQYIHHKNNPNSHVGCTCNAGCTYSVARWPETRLHAIHFRILYIICWPFHGALLLHSMF